MAQPTGAAAVGSAPGIAADLRTIRERGGLHRAADGAFSNIRHWIDAQQSDDDWRTVTVNLVETHVSRAARAVVMDSTREACDKAAADALLVAITRPAGDTTKVATIRRTAQQRYQCALSLDGIRKREDVLVRAIATAIHTDLEGWAARQGPQTIEEFVRYIYEDVKDAWESFDDGLRRLYRLSPMPDAAGRQKVIDELLFEATHMQYWAGRMVGVRMRGDATTETDLMFADAAAMLLVGPFGYYDDKVIANRILTDVGRHNVPDFRSRLGADAAAGDIRLRFEEWLTSCHPECAYQRTYNISLLCEPHRFTYALWMITDIAKSLFHYGNHSGLRPKTLIARK